MIIGPVTGTLGLEAAVDRFYSDIGKVVKITAGIAQAKHIEGVKAWKRSTASSRERRSLRSTPSRAFKRRPITSTASAQA